jgi:hypothetical protein
MFSAKDVAYPLIGLATLVAQTCSLSVSPEIVADRDDFAEHGSVRSTLGATATLDFSKDLWPSKPLWVTDPRSFGCGRVALRCIAELHSASLWETPTRRVGPAPCRIQFGDTA